MTSDVQIYCDCMARIRHRVNVVQTIMSGGIQIGHADQTAKLIFVQFRKTLEEIAFASLSANKEKYAEVHANFSKPGGPDYAGSHGHRQSNPVALPVPVETAPGLKHFGAPLTEGFVNERRFCLSV